MTIFVDKSGHFSSVNIITMKESNPTVLRSLLNIHIE